MYSSRGTRYRETEVLTASPAQLVVIVFDHLLVNLERGRLATERGEVEQRCVALDRARQAVGELLVTLDRERGGELARGLAALYTFMLSELSSIRGQTDSPRIGALTRMALELRESFAAAAADTARTAGAA